MRVAVLGGTGVAGRATVEALRANGHEPVALSRGSGVDLRSGAGLTEGLAGAEAVVDTTNVAATKAEASRAFFEQTAGNLVRAAAETGIGHVVALSIIGIDRVPYGYYQGKVRQEEVLATSSVPVTVLRTTQFHEFAAQYLDRFRGPLVLVPRWRVQPVAVREVGRALAQAATRPPSGRLELAGPRQERMGDMVRRVTKVRGDRRIVLEVPLPGGTGRAMAAGGTLPQGEVMLGEETFEEWLAHRSEGDAAAR